MRIWILIVGGSAVLGMGGRPRPKCELSFSVRAPRGPIAVAKFGEKLARFQPVVTRRREDRAALFKGGDFPVNR